MCGTKSAFRVLHLLFPVNTPYRDFAGIFSPIAVIFGVRHKISRQSESNRINICIPHIFNKCSVARRFQKSSPLFREAASQRGIMPQNVTFLVICFRNRVWVALCP